VPAASREADLNHAWSEATAGHLTGKGDWRNALTGCRVFPCGGRDPVSRKQLIEILAVGALLTIVAVAAGGFLYMHRLNEGLLRAAARGDVDAVRSLLARGANPGARTRAGETALLLAARRGSEEAVRLLLERGADPNARDRHEVTALWWVAARDGVMPNRAAVARLLLTHGALANVRGRPNGGTTALAWAASKGDPGLVRLLIEHGADVNARDRFGGTALRSARRGAYTRAAGLAHMRQLVAQASPQQRPWMRKHVEDAQSKRLHAEAAVRILQRAGATR
jgi:hypothetical protein